MQSVEITIQGEHYELTPSFNFMKRIKKALGTGSLVQIQMAAASLDPTVMAEILSCGLRAQNVNKYSADEIGKMLFDGGILCTLDGEESGGKGAAVKLLLITLDSFTSEGGTIGAGAAKNA